MDASAADEWGRCNSSGPMDAWRIVRAKRPKCNRPIDHTGPHRRYWRDASVQAEWTDTLQEAAQRK